MTDVASVALQKAIFATLQADAGVIAALPAVSDALPIYDNVPSSIVQEFLKGQAPTYVSLGPGKEKWTFYGEDDDETDSVEITDHLVSIAVFSQSVGFPQTKLVMTAVRRALQKAWAAGSIAIAGHAIKNFDPVSAEYSRLDDGFTTAGVLTVRVTTQPST